MPGVAIVRARLLSLEEEEEEEEVGVASVDLFMVSVEMTAPVLLIIQYVFPQDFGFWLAYYWYQAARYPVPVLVAG